MPELFPDKTCTKADFYTFLWNAAGRPQSSGANPFSDVKATDSYYGAAIWAKEKGMISGNTFAPMTNLTRKECIIALWKYAGSPDGFYATQYLEVEKLESDFGRSIGWSHMNGVMGGTDLHKFSPRKSCTRAQASLSHRPCVESMNDVFNEVLVIFYEGKRCYRTLQMMEQASLK